MPVTNYEKSLFPKSQKLTKEMSVVRLVNRQVLNDKIYKNYLFFVDRRES